MKTHKKITDKLERSILAGALFAFRRYKRVRVYTKWYVFASSITPGVLDEVFIDVETWKVKFVCYSIRKGGQTITKEITVNDN